MATTNTLKVKLLETAVEYQQNFYEITSDWNVYNKEEHGYLRDFIGYALFGPPIFKERNDLEKQDLKHFLYTDKEQTAINVVFQKVIEYGINKQHDGIIYCSIIYNVIFNENEAAKSLLHKKTEKQENKSDGMELQVFPVPVFKVKAYQTKTYYVDSGGRVYKGFADYLANNTLPMCTMVLPKKGWYQGDPGIYTVERFANQSMETVITKVWVEVHQSPACTIARKVLAGGDIASTVVTVASIGVGIASLMTPIGAGVALASAAGAGVSGLWSAGRCAQQLSDRGQHGESLSPMDKNAAGAWIGLAGSTVGIAATGGTVLLARAVRTGTTIGRAAVIAYNAVQIGNIVVNGVGIGFKGYDIYAAFTDGGMENVSTSDVLCLTAHVFFFCNSVINVRFARSMIESTQGQLMKDYEASLRSNRHRKEYQRMVRNTRAAGTNDISSNEEIIRAINKIENKDEFYQAMVRIRKTLSASGAKASFSSDGRISVNGMTTIDPIEFASLPNDIRTDVVKGLTNVQSRNGPILKSSFLSTGVTEFSYKNFAANSKSILKEFCLKHSDAMIKNAPPNIADFANVLGELQYVKNDVEIFMKLLEIGYRIIKALPRDVETTVGDILAQAVQFLWDYVKLNLREMQPGMFIDDPSIYILLNKLMPILLHRVETELDEWVKAFKLWLKTQFPHDIKMSF